ncbi:MAG: PIN domain-containing protein [Candidatus Rokubacteria bacterium]|nr:PIN domain-containing protein [Candidatus Rokubacteria bacterium]
MVYLDSSALLKLLWPEPESEAVRRSVTTEDVVIVSSLADLEAEVQVTSGWLAGRYGTAALRRLRAQLAAYRVTDPFRFSALSGSVFDTARQQLLDLGRTHCRTLDRLHLAAMTELGVRRLMTHDDAQARAAAALGMEVVMPGRE